MDLVIKHCLTLFFIPTFLASCQEILINGSDHPPGETTLNSSQFLNLVNEARVKGVRCGSTLKSKTNLLVLDETLSRVAYQHSQYMESRGSLSHKGKNGSNSGDRVAAAGYQYQFLAENIAVGPSSEEDVFELWMNSPGHCENIMEPKAKKLGFGRSGKYWTMVVANP